MATNRRQQPYKPSVVRQYRSALERRFLPEFGDWRLSTVEQTDLLALKERLMGEGIADSTIRNDSNHLELIRRWFGRPLWEMEPADADAYFGRQLRTAAPATRSTER